MQTVLTYLMLLFSAALLHGQNTIEVSMSNFDHSKGTVKVGLYDTKKDFLEKGIVYLSSEIDNEKASVTFTDIPDGIYAVSCYHDKDSNGKLNMFLGMFPTESYGTSNNPGPRWGPPLWDDAKFEVKNGEIKKLEIRL